MNQPVQGFELREKVAQLQAALLSEHPLIPTLLRTIHTQLRADPENVTLLSEEEIQVIVNGLKKQTMTTIITAAISGTKSGGKSLKKITVDDL